MPNDAPTTPINAPSSGGTSRHDLMLTARRDSITPFQNSASSTRPVNGSVQPILVARAGTAAWCATVTWASLPSPATASKVTSLNSIQVVTADNTIRADARAGTKAVSDPLNGGRTRAMNGQRITRGHPVDVTR